MEIGFADAFSAFFPGILQGGQQQGRRSEPGERNKNEYNEKATAWIYL